MTTVERKIPLDSYEHPAVTLSHGVSANAYGIMIAVGKALRKVPGIGKELEQQYIVEAKSGDYDHLLQVSNEYVEVD